MPDNPEEQDALAIRTFLSNCVHTQCSDGTYYCVLGDIINEQSPTHFVRPGTDEYYKVMTLLEKGEHVEGDKPTLKSI